MVRQAWQAAERDAERELILQVVQRYPSVDMLRVALDAAGGSVLQEEAAAAAAAVAQKLGDKADLKKLLAQIQKKPIDVEVIKATYGAGDKQKDVTVVLQKYVHDFPLIAMPSKNYNTALGGDPVPGVKKELSVRYKMDGKVGEAVFAENTEVLVLPMPQ